MHNKEVTSLTNNSNNIKQVINGRKVEFIADTHEYFVDGIKVPSVTQIVASVLPNQYRDIDKDVLKQAAEDRKSVV